MAAREMRNASAECSILVGGAYEAAACAIAMSTGDSIEGVRAFVEKRDPDFKDR